MLNQKSMFIKNPAVYSILYTGGQITKAFDRVLYTILLCNTL